jgi:hypothetical protein
MQPKTVTTILLTYLITISCAFSAYYDTLPEGVRVLDYRNITTTRINSSYNQSQEVSPYKYNINLDAKIISEVDPLIKEELDTIKSFSPDAYNMFSVGEYGIEADAAVNVNVFGLGWGLTSRLTVYFGVPFYRTEVDILYKRIKGDNHQATAQEIHNMGRSDLDGLYESAVEALSNVDIDASFFQSVLVDEYKYKPVGRWVGHDFGDTELGAIYRLTNLKDRGAAMQFGVILPTGYVEDPSIIQDISFGDGQTDLFFEIGGGIFLSEKMAVNSSIRYTYQMPGSRDMRVPESEDFALSDKVGNFDYKLGDKININMSTDYTYNAWLELRAGYELDIQQQSVYSSEYTEANRILGLGTDTMSHNLRLGAILTSVKLFQQKKFLIPGSLDFSILHMLTGQNVAKASRFELQFRMFF